MNPSSTVAPVVALVGAAAIRWRRRLHGDVRKPAVGTTPTGPDRRRPVPQDAARVATALQPDYALGGHTASLGLCWMPAGTLPGFPDGMVIGQHGSWNRSTLSGYKVVFVPFENGRPAGPPRTILDGFLAPDESVSYGRPVGVVVGPDGRSLLVADDVGDVVWRVAAA